MWLYLQVPKMFQVLPVMLLFALLFYGFSHYQNIPTAAILSFHSFKASKDFIVFFEAVKLKPHSEAFRQMTVHPRCQAETGQKHWCAFCLFCEEELLGSNILTFAGKFLLETDLWNHKCDKHHQASQQHKQHYNGKTVSVGSVMHWHMNFTMARTRTKCRQD